MPEGSCWPGDRWKHRMWGGTFSDTSGSPSSLRPLADKELRSRAQGPGSYQEETVDKKLNKINEIVIEKYDIKYFQPNYKWHDRIEIFCKLVVK